MGLVIAFVIITVIGVVGIVGGMTWGVGHPLGSGDDTKLIKGDSTGPTRVIGGRREQKRLMGENGFSFLDTESGATPDDIKTVLGKFRDDEVTGTWAGTAHASLDRAEFSSEGIVTLMEREFGQESLTWERYSAPVEAAFERVVSNSAHATNIIQAFDSAEYQRLTRLRKAGQIADGSQQAGRLSAMDAQLDELRSLTYDSEAMLDELTQLQTELEKLSDSHQEVTSGDIAEEIRNLAESTRQYMPEQQPNRSSVPATVAESDPEVGESRQDAPTSTEGPDTGGTLDGFSL